jgi:hypothetical protein
MVITPPWLRQMDLIGPEDYESYHTEIISPGGTIVSFGSIQMRVLPETMQVATDAVADVETARDLAAGILLSKGVARIAGMGINRTVHFEMPLEAYHAIGDALTPKDLWDSVLSLPGMLNVGVRGVRVDGYGGAVNVQIQPSTIVQPGVFVSVNDHYTLTHAAPPADRNAPPDDGLEPSSDKIPVAVKILTDEFSTSHNRAQAIIDLIRSLGNTGGEH